jgi:hypothetical protein
MVVTVTLFDIYEDVYTSPTSPNNSKSYALHVSSLLALSFFADEAFKAVLFTAYSGSRAVRRSQIQPAKRSISSRVLAIR